MEEKNNHNDDLWFRRKVKGKSQKGELTRTVNGAKVKNRKSPKRFILAHSDKFSASPKHQSEILKISLLSGAIDRHNNERVKEMLRLDSKSILLSGFSYNTVIKSDSVIGGVGPLIIGDIFTLPARVVSHTSDSEGGIVSLLIDSVESNEGGTAQPYTLVLPEEYFLESSGFSTVPGTGTPVEIQVVITAIQVFNGDIQASCNTDLNTSCTCHHEGTGATVCECETKSFWLPGAVLVSFGEKQ